MPSSTSAAICRQSSQVSSASNTPSLSSCISLLYASGRPFKVIIMPVSAPCTRPHLPRINSSASGFFFCGIRDEPEVTRSDSSTKPASPVLKKIRSSAKRDRCTMPIEASESNSSTWSRSETLSRLLRVAEAKPNQPANCSRSISYAVPASAPQPNGLTSRRLSASCRRLSSRASIST